MGGGGGARSVPFFWCGGRGRAPPGERRRWRAWRGETRNEVALRVVRVVTAVSDVGRWWARGRGDGGGVDVACVGVACRLPAWRTP